MSHIFITCHFKATNAQIKNEPTNNPFADLQGQTEKENVFGLRLKV